jgi:hypothetical protein
MTMFPNVWDYQLLPLLIEKQRKTPSFSYGDTHSEITK